MKATSKPALGVRKLFVADVRARAETMLEARMRPGCWRRVVEVTGDTTCAIVSDYRDVAGSMWCARGDGLLVANADVAIDEIAIVRVVRNRDGRTLMLELVHGVLPSSSAIHVMRCMRPPVVSAAKVAA